MFRISLLVAVMVLISLAPDNMGSLMAYKDYFIALLLSLLIKPWLADQFN